MVGVKPAKLTEFLREKSHFYMGGKQAAKILTVVGQTEDPDCRVERDMIIRFTVQQAPAVCAGADRRCG